MRYYFDLEGDGEFTRDDNGTECSGPEEVETAATVLLAEVISGSPPEDRPVRLTTTIRDASGAAVYRAILMINFQEIR